MTAAAVEKPATFRRDTSNSSKNSQLGMANLRYFDIETLRFWPKKKLKPKFFFLLFYYTITIEVVHFISILMTLLKYGACAGHRRVFTATGCSAPGAV
jgi:hypothetical protein